MCFHFLFKRCSRNWWETCFICALNNLSLTSCLYFCYTSSWEFEPHSPLWQRKREWETENEGLHSSCLIVFSERGRKDLRVWMRIFYFLFFVIIINPNLLFEIPPSRRICKEWCSIFMIFYILPIFILNKY